MKTRSIATILASSLVLTAAVAFAAEKAEGPKGREARYERVAERGPRGPEGTGEFGGPRGPEGRESFRRHGGPEGPEGRAGGIFPGAEGLEHMARFWDNDDIVKEVGITPEQIALLEESLAETKESLKGQQGEVRKAYKAVKDAVEGDNPDRKAVNDAIDAATNAQNKLMKDAIAHRVTVNNILTAEQQEALKKARREHARENIADLRERSQEFRGEVRELLADGSLSEEDWKQIDEKLAKLPAEMQDRIRARIKDIEKNGPPEAGDGDGPREFRGPRGEGGPEGGPEGGRRGRPGRERAEGRGPGGPEGFERGPEGERPLPPLPPQEPMY